MISFLGYRRNARLLPIVNDVVTPKEHREEKLGDAQQRSVRESRSTVHTSGLPSPDASDVTKTSALGSTPVSVIVEVGLLDGQLVLVEGQMSNWGSVV